MGAQRPLVAHSLQLGVNFSILHAALTDPHLEHILLRVTEVDVADILEDRLPRGLLLLSVDEVARIERDAQARHVAAE